MKNINFLNVDDLKLEKLFMDLKISHEELISSFLTTALNSNMKNSNPIFNWKLHAKTFEK